MELTDLIHQLLFSQKIAGAILKLGRKKRFRHPILGRMTLRYLLYMYHRFEGLTPRQAKFKAGIKTEYGTVRVEQFERSPEWKEILANMDISGFNAAGLTDDYLYGIAKGILDDKETSPDVKLKWYGMIVNLKHNPEALGMPVHKLPPGIADSPPTEKKLADHSDVEIAQYEEIEVPK